MINIKYPLLHPVISSLDPRSLRKEIHHSIQFIFITFWVICKIHLSVINFDLHSPNNLFELFYFFL